MASILDMSASSDSEDDDYVPNKNASDSSLDEEDLSGDEDFNTETTGRGKSTKEEKLENGTESTNLPEAKVDEKLRAKTLWESFLNDVESDTSTKKSSPSVSNNSNNSVVSNGANAAISNGDNASDVQNNETKKASKPVSEVFEFAGETITIDKDLGVETPSEKKSEPLPAEKPSSMTKKRGLESVLGTIMNKNKKLSVLDKSAIDWRQFKKEEGIGNDFEKYNKGKDGFIERKRFLERSDVRSFELEKSMRQTLRKK